MNFVAQHRFGDLSYLYDAEARFSVIRWKASQYFSAGPCDETKEMLKYWKINPGDVVVDAGAHIGTWTLPALAMGASMVYAFEPQEPSINTLQMNLNLNRWNEKCVLIQNALWDEEGLVIPYYWPISIPLNSATEGWVVSRSEGDVSTTTLDLFFERHKIDRLDWMKIDVDGSEVFLLDGAQETIKEFKPNILIAKHTDIIKSIFGHDVDLKDHLPLVPRETIRTDNGHFIWRF